MSRLGELRRALVSRVGVTPVAESFVEFIREFQAAIGLISAFIRTSTFSRVLLKVLGVLGLSSYTARKVIGVTTIEFDRSIYSVKILR